MEADIIPTTVTPPPPRRLDASVSADDNPFKPEGPLVITVPAPGDTSPPQKAPPSPTFESESEPEPDPEPKPKPSRKRAAPKQLTGFEPPVTKTAREEAAARMRRRVQEKQIRDLAASVDYVAGDDATQPDDNTEKESGGGGPPVGDEGEIEVKKETTSPEKRKRGGSTKPRPSRSKKPQTPSKPVADPALAAIDPERAEIYRVDRIVSGGVGKGDTVVQVADVGTKQIRRERRWMSKHFEHAAGGSWFTTLEDMNRALQTAAPPPSQPPSQPQPHPDRQAEGSPSSPRSPSSSPPSSPKRKPEVRSPSAYIPCVESYYECRDAADGGNVHITLSNLSPAESVRAVITLLKRVGSRISVVSRVPRTRAATKDHRVDHRVVAYINCASDFSIVHAVASDIVSGYRP